VTDLPEDLIRQVERILKWHVGESKALSSKKLAGMLHTPDEHKGTPLTRALITECIKRGMAIGATEKGYFILETEAELNRYVDDLERRERAIHYRAVAVRHNFDQTAPTPLQDPGEEYPVSS
jgi:hypothetical protein